MGEEKTTTAEQPDEIVVSRHHTVSTYRSLAHTHTMRPECSASLQLWNISISLNVNYNIFGRLCARVRGKVLQVLLRHYTSM